MDRRKLLIEILFHLDSALQLMDEAVDKPDDEDVIWNGIMAVHGTAEAHLNAILMDGIARKENG